MGIILTPSLNGVLANRQLEKLLSRVDVQELLLYIQKEKTPSLRMIKAAFPNDVFPDLNEVIEILVEEKYIIREQRCYHLQSEFIDSLSWEMIANDLRNSVERYCQWFNELDLTPIQEQLKQEIPIELIRSHLMVYHLLTLHNQLPLKLYTGEPSCLHRLKNTTMLPYRKEIWVEISHLDLDDHSANSYFLATQRHQTLNSLQQKIFNMIGDVNQEFFLHQCVLKLKRTQRRGVLSEDYNIFNETLSLLEDVTFNENKEMTSHVLIYNKEASLSFFEIANRFKMDDLYFDIKSYLTNHSSLYHDIFSTLILESLPSISNSDYHISTFLLLTDPID